tara:strand:- start:23 stop:127 length:105 start_codon:yes stop_codon:yes gene_type:complete
MFTITPFGDGMVMSGEEFLIQVLQVNLVLLVLLV